MRLRLSVLGLDLIDLEIDTSPVEDDSAELPFPFPMPMLPAGLAMARLGAGGGPGGSPLQCTDPDCETCGPNAKPAKDETPKPKIGFVQK